MAESLLYKRQTIVLRLKSHKSSNFIFNSNKPFAMNSKILLLAVTVAVLSSCTTSYKTGQTPDDVYYSPTRPQGEEYVQRDKKDDDRRYRDTEDDYYEDQYLRMKVRNRYRWSDIDDPYNSRYNYSIYNYGGFNNPWTPATYWNNNYNPYYHGTVIISSQTPTRYSGPRTFNLNSYNNTALTNGSYTNPKATGPGSGSSNTNNTYNAPRSSSSNNGSNSGNILRNIFNSNSSNNNSSGSSGSTNNSSTSTPSTPGSSSSSSSGSSGSSAPVRRF